MKRWFSLLLLLAIGAATPALRGQARDIPSAAPAVPPGTPDQQGRKLLDDMLFALGGPAWFDRKYLQVEARTASFYRGQPNGSVVEYVGWKRYASSGKPEAERVGFKSPRGMIVPGQKVDIFQLYSGDTAWELTFKGSKKLPQIIIDDYYRRQQHSIEVVMGQWLKEPGVMVVFEGQNMVDRKIANRVTVLNAQNDAVTIDIDTSTHLPVRRSFKWRNPQFNDYDEDSETYDDYHTVDGLPTAYTLTRYRNGDMTNQRFYSKVVYNQQIADDLFDPTKLPPGKEPKEKPKKWQKHRNESATPDDSTSTPNQ